MSKNEKYQENNEEITDNLENTPQEESANNENIVGEEALDEKSELQLKLAEAAEKIATLEDKYLRQAAEFDNYRKRTMKEKAELIKNGGERTIEAILPVLDDFERALDNMAKDENAAEAMKGVELIYNKFIVEMKPPKATGTHAMIANNALPICT